MASDRVFSPTRSAAPPRVREGDAASGERRNAQYPSYLGGTALQGSRVVALGVLILLFYNGESPLVQRKPKIHQ